MDIEKLSSKLDELKRRKKELTLKHARALKSIDAQIRELHDKRGLIAIRHKEASDSLEREIAELTRQAKRFQAERAKRASQPPVPGRTPAAPEPAGARPGTTSSPDDVSAAILELLKGRNDISESLLREKLRAKRLNVSELSKQLNKLVSDGLLRRRANNYSLAKKR